jgi:hypothetical protein
LAASGHATALLARLPAIAFGDSGDPLPADFLTYPSWIAHVALAMFLAGVIAGPCPPRSITNSSARTGCSGASSSGRAW